MLLGDEVFVADIVVVFVNVDVAFDANIFMIIPTARVRDSSVVPAPSSDNVKYLVSEVLVDDDAKGEENDTNAKTNTGSFVS